MRTRDMLGKLFTMDGVSYGSTGGARFEDARDPIWLDMKVPFLVVEVMSIPQRRNRYVRVLQNGTSAWIELRPFRDNLRPVGDCQ